MACLVSSDCVCTIHVPCVCDCARAACVLPALAPALGSWTCSPRYLTREGGGQTGVSKHGSSCGGSASMAEAAGGQQAWQ